ncbi:MAG TPA: hypothetical protein VMW69_09165 [Spirochaetia bacterium]|nr:hypothetical protein [Spirochaetia bacterium]
MERTDVEDRLFPTVAPLLETMGYSIVELVSQRRRSGLQVHLVIHRPEGVGVQDCEDVYRAVLPRIEVTDDRRDVHLEVSSPGLTRNLKSTDEFALFVGKRIRVLMDNSEEWVEGILLATDDTGLTMRAGKEELSLGYAAIRRARLEDIREGAK